MGGREGFKKQETRGTATVNVPFWGLTRLLQR